jgi:threonine synthase
MIVTHLTCLNCGKTFAPTDPYLFVCDVCGIDGILEVEYDYDSVPRTVEALLEPELPGLWRYRKLLPVDPTTPLPPLHVGMTPLYRAARVEKRLGLHNVWIKDDGRNPTASLKDRASAVGVTKAREAGAKAICAASTGNAASSLAGFAASVGLPTYIFVPRRAPKAKIAQLLIYGAETIIVDDSYDVAFEVSVKISKKFGWYNRNCAYNPYLVEGKKTVGYEMWEQLGRRIPDRIYVSIGDGCITSGLAKSFHDLKQLGLIQHLPKIVGVQASGCNPVEVALKTGTFTPQNGNTIADSIAVGVPRNRLKALRGLRACAGDCISVSDDEIRHALVEMPRQTGVFGEPAGVTAFAGFVKDAAAGRIAPDETVVVLITGNGLKDIETAISVCTLPDPVPPTSKRSPPASPKKGGQTPFIKRGLSPFFQQFSVRPAV